VVGSTCHGPIGRVLAGDDAVARPHGSPCPVAVAPHGLASREWKPVRSIGVGFDSGPEALQTLALATALARACGASLELRSVVLPAYPVDLSYDTDALERSKAIVQKQLDETIAELPVDATGGVSAGNPVDELTDLSTAVDLLVVGSRSWGPVRRTIVGSTTARGARSAAHATTTAA
jgi:nucleotide-binding universal stress UspA family protein